MGTTKMLNSEKIGANKIDKSVFHSFNQITDANETIRLKNSLQLLQTLAKNDDQNQVRCMFIPLLHDMRFLFF